MPHQTRDTMATHTYIAAGARAGVPYDTAVFTRLLSLSQRLPPVAYVGMGIFELCPLTASYGPIRVDLRALVNQVVGLHRVTDLLLKSHH